MNIQELVDLSKWVKREIVDRQLPQKYTALLSVLQTNSQPNQPKQSFELQKDELIETLLTINTDNLSKEQLQFLEKIDLLPFIGHSGVNLIEDILYKNAIDTATAAQKIQEIIQKVNAAIAKLNQIESGLSDCVNSSAIDLRGQILMRVTFKGNAQLENLTDFKKWGDTWYDIGRGIAMAHNSSPEDIRIIGASKGSIILELAVEQLIDTTVETIILSALKVAEKVLDIRKKAEEIRGLKLANDKISQELEKSADAEKKIGIEEIKKQMVEQLNIKENGEGDKVKALDVSIRDLVTFIEKGGDIDMVIPEDKGQEDDINNQNLRMAFSEIRLLEKKINLIEFQIKDDGIDS